MNHTFIQATSYIHALTSSFELKYHQDLIILPLMLLRSPVFSSSQVVGIDCQPRFVTNILIGQDNNVVSGRALRRVGLKAAVRENASHEECLATNNYKLHFGGLAEDRLSYTKIFIVRFHEVGVNGAATLESIANYFQEAACNQILSVGYWTGDGFSRTPSMESASLLCVSSRMHIEVYKYPLWNDVIEIETWCQAEGSIKARRNWIVRDHATGQIIVRATSKWLFLNQKTRRIQKAPDDDVQEILKYSPKLPRFVLSNNDYVEKVEELHFPAQFSKLGLKPRRTDLDMNKHVNNVTYIGWLLESVPLDIQLSHELLSLTIEYKHECGYDDLIDSFTSLVPSVVDSSCDEVTNGCTFSSKDDEKGILEFRHLLRLSEGGFETNRGRTKWRERRL